MSLEVLKSAIASINTNRGYMDRSMGEEATKHSLVLPILKALGYDPYNPREVRPEYSADPREVKRGPKEKVDYAIFINDEPIILIEAKNFVEPLKGYEGQLQYYCNALLTARLGILTNGLEWWFFTDTKNANHLDEEPFFTIDLAEPNDDERLAVLYSFAKKDFDPGCVQEIGWQLKYTKKLTDFFSVEFDTKDGELSDSFVRWVLKSADCYTGSLTAKAIEQFRPLTKKAFRSVIGQMVSRKYLQVSHLMQDGKGRQEADASLPTPGAEQDGVPEPPKDEEQNASRIITTEEEIASYALLKKMIDDEFKDKLIYDPSARADVPILPNYKDTTAYFGVFINKPSWWIARISLSSKMKWIGFSFESLDLIPEGFQLGPPQSWTAMRIIIEKPIDLLKFRPLIIKAVQLEIEKREATRPKVEP